jgi:hypothetical protein
MFAEAEMVEEVQDLGMRDAVMLRELRDRLTKAVCCLGFRLLLSKFTFMVRC